MWPSDMEIMIELALQRLLMRREQAEVILKNKRTAFENKMMKHQKQLEQVKKRDPPVLTMDEMLDGVQTVEAVSERLQVSIQQDICFSFNHMTRNPTPNFVLSHKPKPLNSNNSSFYRRTSKKRNKSTRKSNFWTWTHHHSRSCIKCYPP